MRVAIVALVLLAAAMPSCTSGGCGAAALTPVEESASAGRATSCAPAVEFEGITYVQWGCPPVRHALLGPIEARSPGYSAGSSEANQGYAARSIEGVPRNKALAVRDLHESKESSCPGWTFWGNADLAPRTLTELAREVNTTGTLAME